MDSTVPWILVAISTPVMLFKQWVNVIQIVKASQWLAQGDLADRARAGLPKKTQ
jgi:CDP-diacylglycerol--inositol 3-phosphatidyltransferase